jgi:hypothetical protein
MKMESRSQVLWHTALLSMNQNYSPSTGCNFSPFQ